MGVIEKVTAQIRRFPEDSRCDLGVSLSGHEKAEGGSGQDRLDEIPGLGRRPGLVEYARVGYHAEEFVHYSPGRVPGRGQAPPFLDASSAAGMKRGVLVGRVHEDVGVDDEHQRPSMAS